MILALIPHFFICLLTQLFLSLLLHPATFCMGGVSFRACVYCSEAQYRPGPGMCIPENYENNLCTHMIYDYALMDETFKAIPTDPNDETTPERPGMYQRFNGLKETDPGIIMTLLSFGNKEEKSRDLFSKMASNDSSRSKFAATSLALARKNGFGGVIYNWKYPSGEEESSNLIRFLQRVEKRQKNEEKKGVQRLTVAVFVAGKPEQIDSGYYNVEELQSLVSFMFVDTHQFHGPWENRTGIRNALNHGVPQGYSFVESLHHWENKGAEKKKLIPVIGTGANGWRLLYPEKREIGDYGYSSDPTTYLRKKGYATFYELLNATGEILPSSGQGVSYMLVDQSLYTLELPISCKTKINHLEDNGYTGVCFESLDQDDFSGSAPFYAHSHYPIIRQANIGRYEYQ